MIAFDDNQWPIVAVRRDGTVSIADATAQIIALDNLLRRREPFGLLVTHEGDTPIGGDGDQGAQGIATRWLSANHELLQTWCRGIAVVGRAEANPSSEPFAAIGCPLAHFADVPTAETWLNAFLAESPALPRRDL